MPCANTVCSIFVVCQKKHRPCPANMPARIVQNGYAIMAAKEQKMRMAAIEFGGNWE